MIRVFFDSEFTELGLHPKLISLGFVSEDGAREFYAELSDTYQPGDCSSFVQEVVIPLLHSGSALTSMHDLCLRLGNWIENLGQPVQLVTDSPSWDWPWIEAIFNLPGTWPDNLMRKPESSFDGGINPQHFSDMARAISAQKSYRRHHALDDARANRLAWLDLSHQAR